MALALAPHTVSGPASSHREEHLRHALDTLALAAGAECAVLADDDGLPLAASSGLDPEQVLAYAAASAHLVAAAEGAQRLTRHLLPPELSLALSSERRLHVHTLRSPAGRLALPPVGAHPPERAPLTALSRALQSVLA